MTKDSLQKLTDHLEKGATSAAQGTYTAKPDNCLKFAVATLALSISLALITNAVKPNQPEN